jgi:hypothetical protein
VPPRPGGAGGARVGRAPCNPRGSMRTPTGDPALARRARSRSAPRATARLVALAATVLLASLAAACGRSDGPCRDGACVCQAESTCDFDCVGDRCAAICADTSTCTAGCDDRCDLTCVDSSECDLTCRDACVVVCERVSTCAVDCGIDCDVTCRDASTCDVVMITGWALCEGVSECTIGCRAGGGIVPAVQGQDGFWHCE